MENAYQFVVCLIMGIALSATCGFKVFVPMLCLSLGAHAGWISLSPGFAWLGSYPAVFLLAVATVLEICTYYIPCVDNLMDAISLPVAVVAGTIAVSSTMVADISPMVKWVLAIVAGGGASAAVKIASSAVRGTSTVVTAGFGNSFVNTFETIGSVLGSLLSILLPLIGSIIVICLLVAFCLFLKRLFLSWKKKATPEPTAG